MRLGFLGTGTAIPSARGASGYVLEAEGEVLLLECGPGSTRRWPAMGLDFARVGAVLCSHHHVDHCGDLAALLFGRTVARPEVHPGLVLAGPRGHRALVDALVGAFGDALVHDDLTVTELDDGTALTLAGFVVRARAMAHPRRNADEAPALGYRIERGGRAVAFSGDTGPCDALVELCRGADVALMECSYPAARETSSHLNGRTVGEMARAAEVQRLVLTHFYPAADEADLAAEVRSAGYDGDLMLAHDGLWIEVAR